MDYNYSVGVKENDVLRDSFNELTRKIFGFDFIEWYNQGYWGDKYIPHVLTDNHKVVSNVSVNIMKFIDNGQVKNYIQLGTVMTDQAYRGKGLSKYLINKILNEYNGRTDGIYLFGNDSVADFYPKFGFKEIEEYEYSIKLNHENFSKKQIDKYVIEKVAISDTNSRERLYKTIELDDKNNPNDAFGMCDNLGLYQFWLNAEYGENIYYLPELKAYIIAVVESQSLIIHQVISAVIIDMRKLARSFEQDITKIKLGYTPADKVNYDMNVHKEEDCTLFILGNDLYSIKDNKHMFPIISHA